MDALHIAVVAGGIGLILLIVLTIYCSIARHDRGQTNVGRQAAVERWSGAGEPKPVGPDQFMTLKRHAARPITIRPPRQPVTLAPPEEPEPEDQDGYIDVADSYGAGGAGPDDFVVTGAVLRDTATRGGEDEA